MEFDIGTLLYIVITIVIIIAGALGNKKKPAANSPKQEKQSGLEGLLNKLGVEFEGIVEPEKATSAYRDDDFLVEEEPVEPEYDSYSESEIVEEESIFSRYQGLYNSDAEKNEIANSEGSRATEDSEIMHVVDLDEEEGLDFQEIIDNFDLGKAVIYSIIIDKVDY